MKQSKNKIECTPTKHEEGAVKSLIQMSKETNAVAFFGMTCEGDYEVMMTARKKGMVSCDEFSLEQFEAIKAMAEEKLAQAEDKKPFQDIIEVCNSNIADANEKAKEQEEENSDDEEEQN